MGNAGDMGGPEPSRRGSRRVLTVAAAIGLAAGVAVGATALAGAATSPSGSAGSTTTTTTPSGSSEGPAGHLGGRFGGGHGVGGAFGGGFGGGFGPGLDGGGVVHGQYTVKGPNGYETIDVRTGTVSAVSNTAGDTWSLSVKSADGSSATFTVNGSTSVNGGESGISSVKSGDSVSVTATESSGTATATQVTDRTTLQANGKAWMPTRPPMSGSGTAPNSPAVTPAPESGSTTSTDA
jgi:hypothetical protein